MKTTHVQAITDLIALVARQQQLRTIAIRYATLVCMAMLCAQATSQGLRSLFGG